jgi:hypothetical protein
LCDLWKEDVRRSYFCVRYSFCTRLS